jgi:hypothetical protein
VTFRLVKGHGETNWMIQELLVLLHDAPLDIVDSRSHPYAPKELGAQSRKKAPM